MKQDPTLPPLRSLLILSLLFNFAAGTATSCTNSRSLMITDVFADVYTCDSSIPLQPLIVTHNGGTIYAATRSTNSGPRVVRLDSSGKFQWFSESRAAADSSTYRYYPRIVVEDTSTSYVYVAGYVATTIGGSAVAGFVMVYKYSDGTLVNSALLTSASYTATCLYSFLLNSSGKLVFAGYVETSSTHSVWAGTLDSSTFAVTAKTINSAIATPTYIYKMIEDTATSNYIIVGGLTSTTPYMWVAAISKATWTTMWEYACTTCTSPDVRALVKLSSKTYAVLSSQNYFKVTASGGISTAVVMTNANIMTLTAETGVIIFAGYDSTNAYSLAYYYDTTSSTQYSTGAQYTQLNVVNAAQNSSYDYIWASAYSENSGTHLMTVVKLACVTPLTCSSGYTNYLNKACYAPTSTSCFALCSQCLISNDINACTAVSSLANPYGVAFFAGRCLSASKFYSYSTSTCSGMTQVSCHPLCGGECLVASDSTACAHHCAGAAIEPHIDDSGLYKNVCKCKVGTAYNSVSLKCESCSPSCGSGGCAAPGNNLQCVNCAAGTVLGTISGSVYVACCSANAIYYGGACVSCDPRCSGCILPGDSTQCLECASSPNINKTGDVSPYTCSCAYNTTYDSGYCVFNSGCHSLCSGECLVKDNSAMCFASCSLAAGTAIAGDYDSYTCACVNATIYNGTGCSPVLHSGCHVLCDTGCTEADNPDRCIGCVTEEFVTTVHVTKYITKCGCSSGTEVVGSICAYTSGCSAYCSGGCMATDNSSACLGCVAGITPVYSSGTTSTVTCTCPTGTAYYNSSCVPILSSTCHPLCADDCVAENDPSKCVAKCSGSSSVVKESVSYDLVTCGCAEGTRLNRFYKCVANISCGELCESCADYDTCVQCAAADGLVLRDGDCVCSSSDGYVRYYEDDGSPKCIKSASTASVVIQYIG